MKRRYDVPPYFPANFSLFSPRRTTFSFGVTAKNTAARSLAFTEIIILKNHKIHRCLHAVVLHPSINRELRTFTMSSDGLHLKLSDLTLSGLSSLSAASLTKYFRPQKLPQKWHFTAENSFLQDKSRHCSRPWPRRPRRRPRPSAKIGSPV